jgi:predicted glycosyltransferase
MKLMVYSHDAFGLGNIRRMLAICQYLLKAFPHASILVVSGSPALHSLRLPTGLDYIKLPCLSRDQEGTMNVRYLNTPINDAVKLRSDLICSVAMNFKPDLFLVDKKPNGLEGELTETLQRFQAQLPETKLVLLLRDILDRPDITVAQWQRHGYYEMIETYYDQVWVVGMSEIFDACKEYQFPPAIEHKVRYCGYIRRDPGLRSRLEVRRTLNIQPGEKLVLLTPGGGADGYRLIDTYLKGYASEPFDYNVKTLIITGPEMEAAQTAELRSRIPSYANLGLIEFTDDIVSYMDAADLVVSMGGYNTVVELLSRAKRAIIVPRVQPVWEQQIRAERMASMGLFKTLHPDTLTPQQLINLVNSELQSTDQPFAVLSRLDMNALPHIADLTLRLLNSISPDHVHLDSFPRTPTRAYQPNSLTFTFPARSA